jgi:hypothetical protein
MSTIDPSSRLLAQIRAQALEWKQRIAARRDAQARDAPSSTGAQDWMAQVARGVVAIDPSDPDRRRKAFRIYLQAVLARECGIQQVGDRAFQELVDRVQETMEADARLRRAIETAGHMLLQNTGG